MEALLQTKVFHLHAPRPLVNFNNVFNYDMDDATALHRFRFTLSQLKLFCLRLSPKIEKNGTTTSTALKPWRCFVAALPSPLSYSLSPTSSVDP
ncbi:hypothetical protein ACHHYP_07072 [Achlya hypogyna]|uniref:Uncharacterized protein n=1 Tax=Achlya hypogyna TaxID=1202772 RepID=A0A1V9ZMV0_ACHHY|nr:hypothetical protein ACHHYP_07072 [Achlya hypogyna]